MGKVRLLLFGVAVAILVLASVSCTEKTYITNTENPDSVHLSGVVLGIFCSGEFWNQPYDPMLRRFSIYTGEPAYVTFIRDNGFTTTIPTDDSSRFDLYLSAGSYHIVLETGYKYPPDTLTDIILYPGDTTLDLDVYYEVLDPLHITCAFLYLSDSDSLGLNSESDILKALNMKTYSHEKSKPVFAINNLSDLSVYRTVHTSEYTSWVYIEYQIPINREFPEGATGFNVLQAYEYLRSILHADSTGEFPESLSLYATGLYPCLL